MTVTPAALYAPCETAQLLRSLRHQYVSGAKKNQPTIHEQPSSKYRWSGRAYRTVDGDHGRIETRTILDSSEIDRDVPVPWLDFPEACFAAQVTREVVYRRTGRERPRRSTCTPALRRSGRRRNACWRSTGAIGALRTASTTSATRCSARTSAAFARACCRAWLRRCRTSRSRSSGCWECRTWRASPTGCTPGRDRPSPWWRAETRAHPLRVPPRRTRGSTARRLVLTCAARSSAAASSDPASVPSRHSLRILNLHFNQPLYLGHSSRRKRELNCCLLQ